MSQDENEVDQVIRLEDQAMQLAKRQLLQYPPFMTLPTEVPLRLLADYRRFLASAGVATAEISEMIQRDLSLGVVALRGLTAGMPYIGAARHAVLLHVTLLIGIEEMRKMSDLWRALRERNFELASEVLMMSRWPEIATEHDEKRRVIDLVRAMRTGIMPIELTGILH